MLHVICTAYNRPIQLRMFIDGMLLQTCPTWRLYIIYDGPAPETIKSVMALYHDSRISFTETPTVNGAYGHPNRRSQLSKLPLNHTDFVLITNEDNYYVPKFIQIMLPMARALSRKIAMVYCNTVHSYLEYGVLDTQLKVDHIDMGSFIVRVDVAKKVGFVNTNLSADGTYAVSCAKFCKRVNLSIIKHSKPLFIHN